MCCEHRDSVTSVIFNSYCNKPGIPHRIGFSVSHILARNICVRETHKSILIYSTHLCVCENSNSKLRATISIVNFSRPYNFTRIENHSFWQLYNYFLSSDLTSFLFCFRWIFSLSMQKKRHSFYKKKSRDLSQNVSAAQWKKKKF